MSRPAIPVVCAVIVRADGRVLLARRPAHKSLGLKWEFPGGKVEPGEQAEAALHRELGEELGCAVTGLVPLPRFDHDYGTVVVGMIPFVCRLADGSPAPHPHEHVGLEWVAAAEFERWDLAPADWPVVASFRALGPG